MDDIKDIKERYEKKLAKRIKLEGFDEGFTRQYKRFKEEHLEKELSLYERLCNSSEKILKVAPGKKSYARLKESIERANLRIRPEGSTGFASLTGLGLIFIGVLIMILGFYLSSTKKIESIGSTLFFSIFFIVLGLVMIKVLIDEPNRRATRIRLKAGDQMVLCILYVVMYMRHTSNLEHAVKFAAQHIDDPLSWDLKKVFWDIEIGRYASLKESLDSYLEKWRDYNTEFVNSFHLVESSLYEPSESRRLEILDRALQTILDGNYEAMLHYAQDLKSPITILYMLGIILPILGLVVLPLMGAFLGVKWYWLAFFYNLILPVLVYFLGANLLAKRPSGQSEATNVEGESFESFKSVGFLGMQLDPKVVVAPLLLFLLLIGFSPLLIHWISPESGLNRDGVFGFREIDNKGYGPFGIVALLLSLVIPLGLGIGLGAYYRLKSRRLIKVRNDAEKLEKEFSGSLFQLGNRIEDGLPAEAAFSRVAENMKGTSSGEFFSITSRNIRKLGMGVEDAIFDDKVGAILTFPSRLVQSSMQVLVESVRKGSKIAAGALISVSNYMSNVHRVEERLKDLMADVLSSMRGQIIFLTPLLAGIVIGIGSMITGVIVKLGPMFGIEAGGEGVFGIDTSLFEQLFPLSNVLPPFFFQLVVGVYLIQITIILTKLANSIENGVDKLNEDYQLGRNLYKAVILYVITAGFVVIMLGLLASGVTGSVGGLG